MAKSDSKKNETRKPGQPPVAAGSHWGTRLGILAALALAGLAAYGISEALRPAPEPKPVVETQTDEADPSLPKADVSLEELLKPGPLGDNVLGNADAKVTIVEYASMTCPHCARFHASVFPQLKEKYIDTGRARLIFREFPLDDLATAVSVLARCADPARFFPFVSTMFERQQYWAGGTDSPLPRLLEMAKQAGFTEESFNQCLGDQKIVDGVYEVRTRAAETFEVNSTPTFFVNGVRVKGGSLEDFEALIEPFLKG